jgi:hypothetical protein
MPSTTTIDFAGQAKTAADFFKFTLFGWGAESVLRAESELLADAETTMAKWLQRRREAVLDTQRLVVQMRESRDLSDVFKAQQDWMAGAFRRLAEDAEGYQKAAGAFANVTQREIVEREQPKEAGGQRTAENGDDRGKLPMAVAAARARS